MLEQREEHQPPIRTNTYFGVADYARNEHLLACGCRCDRYSRGHFFAAAAEAMRRILVETTRRKAREKRGGDWQRIDFEDLDVTASVSPDETGQPLRRATQPPRHS